MKNYTLQQKQQLMSDYKKLQKDGVIGDSFLRTEAEAIESPIGIALDMEILINEVTLGLASEYLDSLEKNTNKNKEVFIVMEQSPQTNYIMKVFLTVYIEVYMLKFMRLLVCKNNTEIRKNYE